MLETIFKRRSIRKYKSIAPEKEKIETILKAAMYSPTGKNTQLWQFLVCDDKQKLREFQSVHPYSKMLDTAPCIILVCGDTTKNSIPYYYMGDCGAAAQTMLLAAYELGLGSCWLGIAPSEERIIDIKKVFDLPEHIIPFCAVAVGYADEERETEDRFDTEKVHYNKW